MSLTSKDKFIMHIDTPAFEHHHTIPKRYTCEGEDISPALHFKDVPAGTVSLALIMDDPDAPRGTFDHWIVFKLPANTKELKEGEKPSFQGTNSYQEQNYRGPCPPPGKAHRYFFKLYALDIDINLPKGASKKALEEAMEGHILAKAELIGLYQRY